MLNKDRRAGRTDILILFPMSVGKHQGFTLTMMLAVGFWVDVLYEVEEHSISIFQSYFYE